MTFWQWLKSDKEESQPWVGTIAPIPNPAELLNALEVPDTTPWWLAVHSILEQLEKEMLDKARQSTGIDNVAALSALDNSFGVQLARQRLDNTRKAVLKRKVA